MKDFVLSLIRTYVPVGVGAALTWLAVHYNFVLDEQTSGLVVAAAVGVVTAVYYTLARAVEHAWPQLGKILVGLGIGKAPTYPKADEQVDYLRAQQGFH